MSQRIAIIGSGISGLTAAHFLHKDNQITLFEANDRLGGHTATIDVQQDGQSYPVDTGFIVFNDWTYPNFIRLMDALGVQSQPTEMSFSLSCRLTGLEYGGSHLGTLFAQKRNIFSLKHWKMLKDILRFNKQALMDLQLGAVDNNILLGDYLSDKGYGDRFKHFYLIPMASAIWSSGLSNVEQMPLQFFVQFFKNHGLLSVSDRPQWRVIKGGSKSYIPALTSGFEDRIRLNCPVTRVRRTEQGISIDSTTGDNEPFDQVIFACHSDQALALLADPGEDESAILSAIAYSQNEVVLHTDESLLPKRRKAWSSWNYLLGRDRKKAVLTYNMNILQGLESATSFCVTMNDTASIDPQKIIGRYQYAHPEFSQRAIEAQQSWSKINGINRTWFCGAWWANGFHEDGVVSALRVVDALGGTAKTAGVG